MAARHPLYNCQRQLQIIAVTDWQWKAQANITVTAIGPVGDLRGDQFFVRYQHIQAVAIAYYDITRIQRLDDTEGVVGKADHIAGMNGFFKDNNKTADKIAYDALQAEAQADGQSAAENREYR